MHTGLRGFVAACMLVTAGPVAPAVPVLPSEAAGVPVLLLTDLGSGQVLAARKPDLSFVPASVTKVMTAYVAFEEIAAGRLARERVMTVSEDVAAQWKGKGTSLYLSAGEQVSVDTLLHGIATVSANDAAIVLAEGAAGSVPAWTARMNGAASRLGMRHSAFNTPNGWPDEGRTYVSAADLVRLASAVIGRHPALYQRYFGQKVMTWGGRTQQSHDPTVGVVTGADGIKTGFTREAGYNFLGSASRDGRRLVMVVAGAKSEEQRATASRALMEWGFAAFATRPLFAAQEIVANARVQGGDARRVPLVASTKTYAVLPKGMPGKVSLALAYKGPLVAPIDRGAQVAELVIRVEGMKPGRVPLYTARAVDRAGPFDRLVNGLMGPFS